MGGPSGSAETHPGVKASLWVPHFQPAFPAYVNVKLRTRFLSADGQFFTGLALPYGVVGEHADAVDRRRVEVNDVGLVVGGGDVAGCVFQLPRI